MIPKVTGKGQIYFGLSRVCGDDPCGKEEMRPIILVCPAYAGMIPVTVSSAYHIAGLSRVCGDDPIPVS